MDSKPQMPDIKAEVNKVDDGKKKATGLLGLLTGGGGTGAAGGLGGLGGLGAGSVGAGGLLATKAGMLALVLMGSAVAGGIGLAGYKMFGPGEADKTGGNLSLFAPRTQTEVDPNAVAPVNADGSSASLNFASAAAAKDKAAEAAEAAAAAASASAAAPTDNTAGDPAKDAAAADAARRQAEARASAGGALNSGGGSGASGTMNLANVKKLGALSGASGGGATTSASASSKLGDSMANAARNGPSSAFSRQTGGAAKASSSSGRGMNNRRNQTARQQAIGVKGDHRGAPTSFAAGKTYDGTGAAGSGASGPEGGGIGMGGVGDGAGAQPKSLPANSANQTNQQEPPPAEPPAKDVTPWAKQIMIGMALGAVAVALLLWATTMIKAAKKEAQLALKMIASVNPVTSSLGITAYADALKSLELAKLVVWASMAAAMGGMAMGAMVTGEPNGQKLQGGLLIASSALILAAGATYLLTATDPSPIADGTNPKTIKTDVQMKAFADPSKWIYVMGGIGAVGLVGTMMSPKKTCKSTEDRCHAYIQQAKSPTNHAV